MDLSKLKVAVLAASVIVAGYLIYRVWKRPAPLPKQIEVVMAEPLKPTEQARVAVAGHEVVTLAKDSKKEAYVPEEGHEIITVKKDGTIAVTVKNKGLTFQPGVGGIYADHLRFSFDVEVAYCGRFGALLGVGVRANPGPLVVPFVAASYQLDKYWLPNTSLMLGITSHRDPVIGLRVAF